MLPSYNKLINEMLKTFEEANGFYLPHQGMDMAVQALLAMLSEESYTQLRSMKTPCECYKTPFKGCLCVTK